MFNSLAKYNIILGSSSPRRREILSNSGIEFTVKVLKNIDETYPPELPSKEVAAYISKKKATAWHDILQENDILITADTTVCVDDVLMGKPSSKKEAANMLWMLSGRTHQVITGVTIMSHKRHITFNDVTDVTFKELAQNEIDYYISNYQPFDKAGAYGIQEWIGMIGVNSIVGSFYNVMGLPIHRIIKELLSFIK